MSKKRIPLVSLFKDKRGEWRWQLWHGNGKLLAASSESFTRKSDAKRNFERTCDAANNADFI